jgi:predicted negative regulator of RcsB-dependent stress response
MVLRELADTASLVIHSWFSSLGIKKDINLVKLFKYIMFSILLAGIAAGSFFAYQFYAHQQEKTAHAYFAQCCAQYEAASKTMKEDELAQAIAMFEQGAQTYAHTALAPYFLVYQSEAYRKQGNSDKGLAVLTSALSKMSDQEPLTNLFKIKQSLLMLDNAQEDMRQAGIAQLESIVRDERAAYQDTAAYYLGSYYWSINETARAMQLWQDMTLSQRQEKLAPSPWVQAVKPLLQHFSA